MTALGTLLGGTAGAGATLAVRAMWRPRAGAGPAGAGPASPGSASAGPAGAGAGGRRARRAGASRGARQREVAVALAAGLAALTVTHWPMAFPLAAAGVLSLRGLRSDAGKATIARLEAIATWTEMLRDTLAGASGLSQALIATAGASPTAIRAAVRRMTDRLTAGMPTEEALIHLASELNDPAADLIIASLVMANRERAQRLGDLLGALAVSAREEITMRLGVEASRASARSAVRMITGFSLGLFVLMSLFARAYLAPYRSMTGQVVLGLVGVVFAFGLYLMGVMIRPRPFPRLEMERAR